MCRSRGRFGSLARRARCIGEHALGDSVLVSEPVDPLRALFEAARGGDDRATGELIEATRAAVWRICRLLGTSGEEEDLVQETYVRALVGIGRFQARGSVLGWLLAIARNVCADDVRLRRRTMRLSERLRSRRHESTEELASWYLVEDVLASLDDDQRDAFLLTQLLGFRYAEAAALLGIPVGTVRSRVARGRQRLVENDAGSDASVG